MVALALALLVLPFALQGSVAYACGYCVEDKVAAVYDHAQVVAALERKHYVAYFEIVGPLLVNDEMRAQILEQIDSVDGVDKGSAGVSLRSAALTFSYDPVTQYIEVLQAVLGTKLEFFNLSLKPLRIIDKPASLTTFEAEWP